MEIKEGATTMRQNRQYLISTTTARRDDENVVFVMRSTAPAAIRAAEAIAIDYDADMVTVYSGGSQLAVFTGSFWVQVTDSRIRKALAAASDSVNDSGRSTSMTRFNYPTAACAAATDDTGYCVKHETVHEAAPVHTVGGKTSAEGWAYGVTHDMDCPGCKDTPFLISPRSETYWSS
jgi:hypothetical protein